MGALVKNLYILHGWTTNPSRWEPFLAALKQENITPVFLQIPGLTAEIDKAWTLDDYVEWLYGVVKKDTRISLLGHSNGGRIALAFALKHPEEVAQLFLVDCAGVIHNDMFSKVKRNVFKTVAKVGKTITSAEGARNLLHTIAGETDYKNASPIQRETMKNLISVDLTPRLRDVMLPTVIIWGKDDQITPYSDALIFKNGIPNSILFPIDHAHHSPQFTHIPEVVKIIKEHLN